MDNDGRKNFGIQPGHSNVPQVNVKNFTIWIELAKMHYGRKEIERISMI